MKNKVINATFVTMLGLLGVLTLSSGYIYAAQGGVNGDDKKQLGLFNGNGEFMGTLVGVTFPAANGGYQYISYLSTIDAIIATELRSQDIMHFSIRGAIVYFDGANCTGNAYLENGPPFLNEALVVPQMLYSTVSEDRHFVIDTIIPSLPTVISKLNELEACENIPSQTALSFASHEVTLPFTLSGQPRVMPL